jgi:hypothetical protein
MVPVGFPFQVVALVLLGLSYLPALRLVTELVHSVELSLRASEKSGDWWRVSLNKA